MSDPWADDDWEEWVDRPLPRKAKEIPVAGRNWLLEPEPYIPVNEYQALMEAAPNEQPTKSRMEYDRSADHHDHPIYRQLASEISLLTEEELAVVECMFYSGHSVRETANILNIPKSTVHRIKESVTQRLKRRLT